MRDTKNTYTFNILDELNVTIQIDANPYQIPLKNLFGMAARVNKKRGFLFVSNVLGKHIPVSPTLSLLMGTALASHYMEVIHHNVHPYRDMIFQALRVLDENLAPVQEYTFRLPERTLFIGFAETATALGHSVFHCFENGRFLHTTREKVKELAPLINFEEEHSHATAQRVFTDKCYFDHCDPIVLVDDEITTGKTALNIIESIEKVFPRKKYVIISILDWRSEEDKASFKKVEDKLGISIQVVSLVAGSINVEGQPLLYSEGSSETIAAGNEKALIKTIGLIDADASHTSYTSLKDIDMDFPSHYLVYTGRFGLSSADKMSVDRFVQRAGKMLKATRVGAKTLCVGTGEFMYLPMRIAAEMGEGVKFQSSTRSPIHSKNKAEYMIKHKLTFESPEDPSIINFLYNIPVDAYDEIFLFLERTLPSARLSSIVEKLQIIVPHLHIVECGGKVEVINNE